MPELVVNLTKREAEAVLRAELSAGHGVIRSQALQSAEAKLRAAVIRAIAVKDDLEREAS